MVFDCKVTKSFLILDINAAKEIAGDNVNGGSLRVGIACGMITDTADETTALHFNVDMGGYVELDATTEGVDVNLLILGNHSLAQVHTDATAEGIETGTMERLTTIDVLVATVMHATADAFAVLADGQRTLQPLVWISAIAVYDHQCT